VHDLHKLGNCSIERILREADILCCDSVTDQTLVADDKEAGAFGPGARDLKIRNLRTYLFSLHTCVFQHSDHSPFVT